MRRFKDIEFRNNFIFFVILMALMFVFFVKDYLFTENSYVVAQSNDVLEVIPSERAREIIAERSEITIRALKFQNLRTFKKMIHPKKGVRFSPYPYILSRDVLIEKTDFIRLFKSDEQLVWGIDNDMQPIKMSFSDYYEEYVYSEDFANYDALVFNPNRKHKNIIDNTRQFYPKSILVEYHLNDTNPYNEKKDWAILRFVYEQYRSNWYLVGVINIRGINTDD